MQGVTVLVLFLALWIIPSYSRPRVSNDNAYSEALFKTVNYTPGYPTRFTEIAHARIWFADFAYWYNTEHCHSGIGYVTPEALPMWGGTTDILSSLINTNTIVRSIVSVVPRCAAVRTVRTQA